MPALTADTRLFGLDLGALATEWRQAWAHALRSPWLSWLTPEAVVALRQADGERSLWWNGARLDGPVPKAPVRFQAVELPESLLLTRTLTLPAVMARADLASALALQAQALSPFPADDLVWGWRLRAGHASTRQADLVLASRRQIAGHLQGHAAAQSTGPAPEVWALLPAAGAPLVLPGYGEGARRAWAVRGRWLRGALLALALALLAAIALTPTLQLRARAIEAVRAYDEVARATPALVQQREQLLRTADKLGTLSGQLAARIEPLRVLDRLTAALPDDAALQGLSLKGNKVTITGLANNSSALMQVLGQLSGVRDVRAPGAATRTGGANSRENFVIEFTLEPQEFGVATAAPAGKATP